MICDTSSSETGNTLPLDCTLLPQTAPTHFFESGDLQLLEFGRVGSVASSRKNVSPTHRPFAGHQYHVVHLICLWTRSCRLWAPLKPSVIANSSSNTVAPKDSISHTWVCCNSVPHRSLATGNVLLVVL